MKRRDIKKWVSSASSTSAEQKEPVSDLEDPYDPDDPDRPPTSISAKGKESLDKMPSSVEKIFPASGSSSWESEMEALGSLLRSSSIKSRKLATEEYIPQLLASSNAESDEKTGEGEPTFSLFCLEEY
jgi:hypothetical protein